MAGNCCGRDEVVRTKLQKQFKEDVTCRLKFAASVKSFYLGLIGKDEAYGAALHVIPHRYDGQPPMAVLRSHVDADRSITSPRMTLCQTGLALAAPVRLFWPPRQREAVCPSLFSDFSYPSSGYWKELQDWWCG